MSKIFADEGRHEEEDKIKDRALENPQFTNEDILLLSDNPELVEQDKFFKQFWSKRSSVLNERFIKEEKIY